MDALTRRKFLHAQEAVRANPSNAWAVSQRAFVLSVSTDDTIRDGKTALEITATSTKADIRADIRADICADIRADVRRFLRRHTVEPSAGGCRSLSAAYKQPVREGRGGSGRGPGGARALPGRLRQAAQPVVRAAPVPRVLAGMGYGIDGPREAGTTRRDALGLAAGLLAGGALAVTTAPPASADDDEWTAPGELWVPDAEDWCVADFDAEFEADLAAAEAALERTDPGRGTGDIWTVDLARGAFSRPTMTGIEHRHAAFPLFTDYPA